MIAVSWGDEALGMGADGYIYKAPSLRYESMTVHKGPTTSPYTVFAQSYGDVCVAMREDGKLDFFLRSSGASIADAVELGSGNTKYLGYSGCKNTTFMYFGHRSQATRLIP